MGPGAAAVADHGADVQRFYARIFRPSAVLHPELLPPRAELLALLLQKQAGDGIVSYLHLHMQLGRAYVLDTKLHQSERLHCLAVMPCHLAWVICASIRLLAVRLLVAVAVPSRDVYSWPAHGRAWQRPNPENLNGEELMVIEASANNNAAAMAPRRRRQQMIAVAIVLHGLNAFLVGMSVRARQF